MALNTNYQGSVYSADGSEQTCFYQAYVPSINKWGNRRETEQSQYNINYGDGDLKTQSGSVSNGEVIVIAFWTGSEDRNLELDTFSAVSFIYNGNDSTVQDIQLLPPHRPSCSFGLPSSGYVGVEIKASSHASLIHQWVKYGCTHYQRPSWYGGDIYDFMEITNDDFVFESDYTPSGDNIYGESGDYIVRHRVINSYGLQSVCERAIRIKYFHPIPTISFSPENLVIGESIGIADSVQDTYSRVTNIEHIFDGEAIESNTDNIFAYAKTLSVFRQYIAKMIVHWNDGFTDNVLTITASPTMVNQPPTVGLTITSDDTDPTKGLHKATVVAEDREGSVVGLNWKIFFLDTNSILPNPYFSCTDDNERSTFNKIYDSDTPVSITSLDLLFAIKGTYKINITAYDEQGLSSSDSEIVTITEVCANDVSTEDCGDLDEKIAEAIRIYEKEHQYRQAILRREEIGNSKLIVVQDGLAEDSGIGRMYGDVDTRGKIIATEKSKGDGSVGGEPASGTGSNSNSIVGG